MNSAAYIKDLASLVPEIVLTITAVLGLMVHLFVPRRGARLAGYVSIAGLAAALGTLVLVPHGGEALFSGTLAIDGVTLWFKALFIVSCLVTIVLAFGYYDTLGGEPGELYYLLVMSVIGMMIAVSATELVTIYVAFETFAIISYLLAGLNKAEVRSSEAGIKYFILGIVSSAIMLLGMAILYAITGASGLGDLGRAVGGAHRYAVLAAMTLIFTGLFFKIALVPFHLWTPDVYEGAPTPLVVMLSTAPKAAAFAVLLRFITMVFPGFRAEWQLLFGILAVATMTWGNIAALIQDNVKRMMAYSSIAHAGYLMIALAVGDGMGLMALLFYLTAYLFMNAAAFALALVVPRGDGFGESTSDVRGLARTAPVLSAGIVVMLLSLTGIPPTGGFIGKYYLFAAAVGAGAWYLAVAGALNSVLSLFYYFRIGRALYMEEGAADGGAAPPRKVVMVVILATVIIAVLGILPGPLTDALSTLAGTVQ